MEKLLTLKEKELYADKAYASKKHDQLLKEKAMSPLSVDFVIS